MKNTAKLLLLVSVLLIAFSCKQNTKDQQPTDTESAMSAEEESAQTMIVEHNDAYMEPAGDMPLGDNSRVSLDWPGTYQGVIPCDGCDGIRTRLTLNEDGTYERSMSFLGKETEPIDQEGTFKWDKGGFNVTIEVPDGADQTYQVGEGRLYHIDKDGKHLNEALAEEYVMVKVFRDNQLEDQTWVLFEMMNKPIDTNAGLKRAELTFNSEEGLMIGNNSCNNIRASYVIRRERGLSLGMIASTKMACPDMSVADKLDEILDQTNRYEIHGDTLSLDHEHMAPLARFVRAN